MQDRLFAWITLLILVAGVTLKLGLIGKQLFPFNADEAIVALMARHILQGHWPLFFYGQAYMGSLDAGLVALGFSALGEQVVIIRIIQTILYAFTILTSIGLARRILKSEIAALVAGIILALPVANLVLYTTVSLGGYGEALLIGNLIFISSLNIIERPAKRFHFMMWGILTGLGFWAFGLTLVYSVPSAFVIVYKLRGELPRGSILERISLALLGMLLGLVPVFAWIWRHGISSLLQELAGSAIAGVSGVGYLPRVMLNLRNFFLFGPTVFLGLRPPWDSAPLFLPGLLFVLLFWSFVFLNMARSWRQRTPIEPGIQLLLGMGLTLVVGFLISPFGADPSGRYFLPISVLLTFAGGSYVAGGKWPRPFSIRILLLAGLLFFHLGAMLEAANPVGPGYTTQFDAATRIDRSYDRALIDFMLEKDETRGYTTYWISYPIAFLSKEQLVFVPGLPYHDDLRYTARDNRYTPYQEEVQAHGRHAFITAGPPALDKALEKSFLSLGIGWQRETIGQYHIYYKLSRMVSLEELDLPWIE